MSSIWVLSLRTWACVLWLGAAECATEPTDLATDLELLGRVCVGLPGAFVDACRPSRVGEPIVVDACSSLVVRLALRQQARAGQAARAKDHVQRAWVWGGTGTNYITEDLLHPYTCKHVAGTLSVCTHLTVDTEQTYKRLGG